MTDQVVLAPPIDRHAGGVDQSEPLPLTRTRGTQELGSDGPHRRVLERPRARRAIARSHKRVGLQQRDRIRPEPGQPRVHRLGVRHATSQSQPLHAKRVGHRSGLVSRRVVDDQRLVEVLSQRGAQRMLEQRSFVRGQDHEAGPHPSSSR